MSDYTRTSRECAPAGLRPELIGAIRQYIEKHELDLREADALICCETTSTRKKGGLFGKPRGGGGDVTYSGVIVTPGWLIWATGGAKQGISTVAARLAEIEVQDYTSTLIPDNGVEVFGFMLGAAERGQIFIGLGPEPAAAHFRQVLRAAVARAHGAPQGARA